MAKYKEQRENGELAGILDTETGANIPIAESNRHYQKYQEWLSAGNAPDPADPEPQPTCRELRRAEYPPIADVVDEILKVITIPAGSGLEVIEALRQAIKIKYPKAG